jgi:hypothetical protein
MVGISVWGALAIPVDARVAIHFDLHGRANGFAGKWAALLPLPWRNGLFGIRMPWTLRSDEVWRRTHALGGRLFVALGVATLAGALVSTAVGHTVLMGGLALLVLGTGTYSYRLSHKLSGD